MARLFATIESERTEKPQVGNEHLEIKIYYGSRDDSRLLTYLLVKAKANGSETPEFFQHNTISNPKPFVANQLITIEKILSARMK